MTDVRALNRVLPATGIKTDCLAQIHGSRSTNKLDLLVPPAGWDEPAVGVTELLAFALTEAGHAQVGVNGIAAGMASTLLAGLSLESRPVMIGWPSDGAVCCSVSEGMHHVTVAEIGGDSDRRRDKRKGGIMPKIARKRRLGHPASQSSRVGNASA